MKKLNILTYNIHKGFNWNNSRLILSDIREVVRSTQADLVFLQEVVGENNLKASLHPDWPDVPQYEYLADTIWKEFAYAKNAIYEHRHHGNVILSKYPILKWEQIAISTNKFEQRGVLFCEIKIEDEKLLHAYCVHLDLTKKGRLKQYEKLVKIIQERTPKNTPLIIAGDFNDWDQKACSILERDLDVKEGFKTLTGEYAKTFPSFFPMLPLDRLYLKNYFPLHCKVFKDSKWKRLSDHAALYIEGEIL